MNFEILTDAEFNEFAEKHILNNFHQNSYWGDLKEKNGWSKHLIGIKQNNEIICASLLLSKKLFLNKYMFYSPRGFLIDFNNLELLKTFTNYVKKYIKKNNGFFLKIDPYIINKERDNQGDIIQDGINNSNIIKNLEKLGFNHKGFDLKARNLQPRWISVLDFKNITKDNLLKSFDTQRRSRINKSLDLGFTVRTLKKEELNEFKKITEHTSKRRNFIDRPLSYYEDIYDTFVKNNYGKFLIVELNTHDCFDKLNKCFKGMVEKKEIYLEQLKNNGNEKKINAQLKEIDKNIVSLEKRLDSIKNIKDKYGEKIIMSGALFLTFGDEVVYLSSGSYEEFMDFNAQYYMQWYMINEAIDQKYKKYNFYGISGNFDKNDDRYGVYDFKRGFGANVVELIGEFDIIINKPFYLVYSILFSIYRYIKKAR